MCCCRPFAERRGLRGLSLLEVMISQSIALVVIAAMMSLVVAMVQRMQSETATSDAQVRLRQVTHLLLRDTQGIGGSSGASTGDLVFITDGGTTAADEFTIFKRDESVCGGGVGAARLSSLSPAVSGYSTFVPLEIVDIDPTAAVNLKCPMVAATCPVVDIAGRSIQLVGATRSIAMSGQTAASGSTSTTCRVTMPTGSAATQALAAYNARYGTTLTSIPQLLTQITPTQVLFGSNFTFRVRNNTLQRTTDGTTWVEILPNVLDLQVERVYVTATGAEHTVAASTGSTLPSGVADGDFIGLRIGIVTFAKTQDGLLVPPPSTFSNRVLTGSKGYRYRSSFVFAASRNRIGA